LHPDFRSEDDEPARGRSSPPPMHAPWLHFFLSKGHWRQGEHGRDIHLPELIQDLLSKG
jgi:hypothetical protein